MKKRIMQVIYQKRMLLTVFLSVLTFALLAHSFGIFNPSFSVDSMVLDLESDMGWQYSIGRILQPLYRRLTSNFALPFLSQVLWVIFLSLAIYYLTKIFQIKNYLLIILLSGILSTCVSTTYTIVFSFQWNEVFSLSLFLSVLSVYLIRKYKRGYIWGGLLNLVILCLYQSYICATIGLLIISVIIDLLKGENTKNSIYYLFKSAIVLICGAVLYFVTIKLLERFELLSLTNSYNAVGSISLQSPKRYIELIIKSYFLFFRNIILSSTYEDFSITLIGAQEIFSALLLIFAIGVSILYFYRIIKNKQIALTKVLLILFLICCLPLGFAMICLFSNGLGNFNAHYQGFLIYVLPIILYEIYTENKSSEEEYSLKKITLISVGFAVSIVAVLFIAFIIVKNNSILKNFACQSIVFILIPIMLWIKFKKSSTEKGKSISSKKYIELIIIFIASLVIFNNIIFANKLHTNKYLANQRTIIEMSNIAQMIDEYENFDVSIDKVYFYGVLGGEEYQDTYIFSHKSYYFSYFKTFLNRNYNSTYIEKAKDLFTESENEVIKDIPNYPNKNCMIMIGDVLVVKLSNEV